MFPSKNKKMAQAVKRYIQENGVEELRQIFDEQAHLNQQFVNDNMKDMTQILKTHLKQGGRYSTLKLLKLACSSVGIDIEFRENTSVGTIQLDYSDNETTPSSSTFDDANNTQKDVNKNKSVENIDDEENFLYDKLYDKNDDIMLEECGNDTIVVTENDNNTDNILTKTTIHKEKNTLDNESYLAKKNVTEEHNLLEKENETTPCINTNNLIQHTNVSNPLSIEKIQQNNTSIEDTISLLVDVQKTVISPTGTGESIMITIVYRVIEQQIDQLKLFEFSKTLNAAEIADAILNFQSYVAYVINYTSRDNISHNRDIFSMLYNMYISKESIVQSMRRLKGAGGYSGKTLYSTMTTIRHTKISDLCRYGGIIVQLVNTNFVIPFVTPEIISVQDICEKHTKARDIPLFPLRYETKVLKAARAHLLSTPGLQVLKNIIEKNKINMSGIQ